jgi:spermidine synthase
VGRLPAELLDCGAGHLDALELDPALFGLAGRPTDPRGAVERPEVHFADARRFIKAHSGPRYDLILLNLPDPLSAFVNRLYTVEFFREAKAALSGDGVLITSVSAAANYVGETVGLLSASILRTLQKVFPEVLVAPGESHTFIAAAKPGTASLNPAALGRRIAQRGIHVGAATDDEREVYAVALFENLITTSQVESLRQTLDAVEAPANSDARPITYQLALLVWNQVVSADATARDPGLRGGTNALFRAALGFRFEHGLVLPALILVPSVFLVALGRRNARAARGANAYGLLIVAAATGLFGMASEIILIYAFQGTYGYAYAEVGLLVAAFMVGLATGARLGGRWARRPLVLPAIIAAMAAYCVALPVVLGGLAVLDAPALLYGAFLALVLLAGFLDGATFPPLVQVLRQQGFERPGGWVYAADLAGSGIGALATGALLVPVLGTASALLLVAATLAAAMACYACQGKFTLARPMPVCARE